MTIVKNIFQKNDWILLLDIIFVSVVVFYTGSLLIDILSSFLIGIPYRLIYAFCTLASIILGNFYLYIKYPFNVDHFGFYTRNAQNTIKLGLYGGVSLGLFNFPYKIIMGDANIPYEQIIQTQQGMHFVFFFLIIAVIFIPIVEEVFFRAFLYRLFRIRFGLVSAYLVSTSFFAVAHTFRISSIIISLILCYIYEKSGKIGSSIIAHMIVNFVWFTVIYIKAESIG